MVSLKINKILLYSSILFVDQIDTFRFSVIKKWFHWSRYLLKRIFISHHPKPVEPQPITVPRVFGGTCPLYSNIFRFGERAKSMAGVIKNKARSFPYFLGWKRGCIIILSMLWCFPRWTYGEPDRMLYFPVWSSKQWAAVMITDSDNILPPQTGRLFIKILTTYGTWWICTGLLPFDVWEIRRFLRTWRSSTIMIEIFK